MPNLVMERTFDATPEKVFTYLSKAEHIVKWWGPEGMTLPEHELAFDKTGPWLSVMQNAEGQQYKVSGQVTHVDPPNSVGFTWGWHDDQDQRGAESHVTLTVEPAGEGARLILDHRELGDDEIAANHNTGWTSSLRKLEAQF